MMNSGIVAVGDICNNTLTIPQKLKQRLAYYNFIEVSGWLPNIAQQRFERSKLIFDAFEKISNSKNSLAPHAPYSVSNELWKLIAPHFQNKTTTIHNQETAFEDDLFKNKAGDFIRMFEKMNIDNSFFQPTGKSSVASYAENLSAAKNILLVHNTFTQKSDIDFLLQIQQTNQQFFYCLCVKANAYIEHAFPPVRLFQKNNCNIVLGTDSLASNWSLNILDEIKTIVTHHPEIETAELLQWATINGARALQMENVLGSFDIKKQPGIILIQNTNEEKITAKSTIKKLV